MDSLQYINIQKIKLEERQPTKAKLAINAGKMLLTTDNRC